MGEIYPGPSKLTVLRAEFAVLSGSIICPSIVQKRTWVENSVHSLVLDKQLVEVVQHKLWKQWAPRFRGRTCVQRVVRHIGRSGLYMNKMVLLAANYRSFRLELSEQSSIQEDAQEDSA